MMIRGMKKRFLVLTFASLDFEIAEGRLK